MKTTLRIGDHLYRRAKAKSSELGVSLTRFFEEAVEERLEKLEIDSNKPVELPVSSVSGLALDFDTLKKRISEVDLEEDLERLV